MRCLFVPVSVNTEETDTRKSLNMSKIYTSEIQWFLMGQISTQKEIRKFWEVNDDSYEMWWFKVHR